jgi:serine/threonine protein kinase
MPLAVVPAPPVTWPGQWDDDDSFGDPVLLRGYEITAVVRQGVSGGTYRGVDLASCRTVFIKEASPGGLRQEHDLLRRLHERELGLAPEPLAHFSEGDSDHLVTALVPGQPLTAWAAGAVTASYYDQCRAILRQVSGAAVRMHRHGVLPGVIEPADVLVATDGRVRLTGFGPIARAANPVAGNAADPFGLSRLARCLLRPHGDDSDWRPARLEGLRGRLERLAPVPAELWELACAGELP